MRDPLIVYSSADTGFTSNGLRVLSPISAEHTIEMNQAGSIRVECPIDDDGDWKTLVCGNIIRAPIKYRGEYRYQPFRIYRITKKRTNGAASITADALHIFYDLNYVALQDVRPTNLSCQDAIEWVMNRPYNPAGTSVLPLRYFQYYSDIETLATAYYEWKTMTGALIGEDNSILERWGGELYVDGYYFSICSTMEGSLTDAFQIIHGINLMGVEETVDITNTFSQLAAQDNVGNVAHASVPISYSGLPYEKTLYAKFSYSEDISDYERNARFANDFGAYMRKIQEAEVGYKIEFSQLDEDDPFFALENYEVGDTGTVIDAELGIETSQRILKKTTDLLTGKIASIETGNIARSFVRKQSFSNTVNVSQSAAQTQLDALTAQVNEIDFAMSVPTPIATEGGAFLTTALGKYLTYEKG